jgi:hypothetical protein
MKVMTTTVAYDDEGNELGGRSVWGCGLTGAERNVWHQTQLDAEAALLAASNALAD